MKAIIGQVVELLENEVIFDDNTKGNEEKWLVVMTNGLEIKEFESISEAKDFCKNRWSK